MKSSVQFRRFMAAVTAVIMLVIIFQSVAQSNAATFRQGSTGAEVRTIQTKLKRWGYYTGSIDGSYGSQTTAAVKKFQQTNGLPADGICGPKTLAALGMSSGEGASPPTAGGSKEDSLNLLARMISAEARGEPYNGQVAVGAVIINRIEHASFPNTLAGVLYQKSAFSSVDDGNFASVVITDSARRAAQDALNGSDPSGGAIYFYNPAKSTSKWIFSRPVICTIGKHVFAR